MIILNLVVLIFEILFYSLFMKFCNKENKFYKYLISGICLTAYLLIIGSDTLFGTLLMPLIYLLSMKYIAKSKTNLYDFIIITIMIYGKIFVEIPCYILFNFLGIYTQAIISSIIKIVMVILTRNYL